jgi:hypothetical protein
MGFGDKSKKEKQAETSAAASAKAKKGAEDASWQDNDKGTAAKANRAAAAADKEADKLARKEELRALQAAEEESLAGVGNKKKPEPKKMTQAQIAQKAALLAAAKKQAEKKAEKEATSQPELKPNMNHINRDKALEAAAEGYELVDVSGVDAALAGLGGTEEKGEKMTYKKYEARVMQELKDENPGLKQSQLKELAWKNWKKSPENPENQAK